MFSGVNEKNISFVLFFCSFFKNRLASLSEKKHENKVVIPKLSSRNVIGVVGGRPLTEKVNFDADTFIKQCQERLKTDPKYKQSDYDVDFARCKALKMPPNRVMTNDNWDAKGCSELVSNEHDFGDDDDDIFNGFDTFTTNHYDKQNDNVRRLPHGPSLSMMNLATPESRTSFFFY